MTTHQQLVRGTTLVRDKIEAMSAPGTIFHAAVTRFGQVFPADNSTVRRTIAQQVLGLPITDNTKTGDGFATTRDCVSLGGLNWLYAAAFASGTPTPVLAVERIYVAVEKEIRDFSERGILNATTAPPNARLGIHLASDAGRQNVIDIFASLAQAGVEMLSEGAGAIVSSRRVAGECRARYSSLYVVPKAGILFDLKHIFDRNPSIVDRFQAYPQVANLSISFDPTSAGYTVSVAFNFVPDETRLRLAKGPTVKPGQTIVDALSVKTILQTSTSEQTPISLSKNGILSDLLAVLPEEIRAVALADGEVKFCVVDGRLLLAVIGTSDPAFQVVNFANSFSRFLY